MKICTIIGARPQFVKAAAVSAEIAKTDGIEEVIVHTGQHYDPEMSEIFFSELAIPKEKYNLNVGSGNHGVQTGRMIEAIEELLLVERPDWVLIYGDTNSTLAGALAAVKLHTPCAHVEAGMRSFNRKMPEEINRVVSDHVCDLNLCSTRTALDNLVNEGRGDTGVVVGDVMYDCALNFAEIAARHHDPVGKFRIESGTYILMTCHRAENTNAPKRLKAIVEAVNELAEQQTVLYPIHPRTKSYLTKYGLSFSSRVMITSPVSYLEMLLLEKNAALILTDSGGVQKEAFFYGVPCVTMRDETEWVETIELGWNKLAGADRQSIINAVKEFKSKLPDTTDMPKPYGDGDASAKVLAEIIKRS